MASRTQLRLGQITGSFGDREGGIIDSQAKSSASSLSAYNATSGSMVGVMSDIVSSILRIHGDDIFASNTESTLKDLQGTNRITYLTDAKLLLSGGGSAADSVDIHSTAGGILLDVDNSGKKIHLDSEGALDFDAGAGATLDAVNAVQITSSTGDVTITADANNKKVTIKGDAENATAIHLDGNAAVGAVVDIDGGKVQIESSNTGANSMTLDTLGGLSIDAAAASNITVATDGDEEDLTISVTGATDSSLHLSSAGTAADALTISTSAGGMDITVAGAAAGEDLDITSNSSINIQATENATDSLVLSGSGVKIDGSVARGISIGTSVPSVPITIGHSTSEVTVADNLTVTGDLTVNGTSTTVNSTTVTIDDQFILLADGAQSLGTPSGIVFASGSNISARPDVAIARVDTNVYGIGSVASHSGSAAQSVPASSDFDIGFRAQKFQVESDANKVALNANQLRVTAQNDLEFVIGNGRKLLVKDNGGTNEIGKFEEISGAHLAVSSSRGNLNLASALGVIDFQEVGTSAAQLQLSLDKMTSTLTASSGNNLILGSNDTFIQFDVAENDIFTIKSNTGESILSSSAGRQIILESNDGKVGFKDPVGSPGQLFEIDVISNAAATSFNVDAFQSLLIGGTKGAETLILSGGAAAAPGTLQIKGGAASGSIAIFDAGQSHSVRLAAPALSADVHFNLPATDGANGTFLSTDGEGNLSFSTPAGIARKGVFDVPAGIAAGGNFDINTGADLGSDNITLSGVDSSQGRLVDVFVNGQLMSSGSEAQRIAGDCDFNIHSTTRLKFSFALEKDDIVTVVKRG